MRSDQADLWGFPMNIVRAEMCSIAHVSTACRGRALQFYSKKDFDGRIISPWLTVSSPLLEWDWLSDLEHEQTNTIVSFSLPVHCLSHQSSKLPLAAWRKRKRTCWKPFIPRECSKTVVRHGISCRSRHETCRRAKNSKE